MKKKKSETISTIMDNELLVVEDRSKIDKAVEEGRMMPEQAEEMFAQLSRKGKMMNTEDGKRFKEAYGDKVKVFVGASDAAVIAGHSPFKSKTFLQLQLLGKVETTVTATQQHNFDYGHEGEPFVAGMCNRKMRRDGMKVRFVKCVNGYIHSKYPHVLIHADGFELDTETEKIVALAEVKTAQDVAPHWANDFSRDIIPLDYQDQCQVMMKVLALDGCWVLVYNKTGDADAFKYLYLERDEEKATALLEAMEQFCIDTENGVLYDETDLLPEEAALLYGETDASLGYVKIPKKHKKLMKEYDRLEAEKAALKEDIAEKEAAIREIDKDEKLVKAQLQILIKKAPGGTFTDGKTTYHISKKSKYHFDAEVREELAKNFPDASKWLEGYKPYTVMEVTKVTACEDGQVESTKSDF